MKTAIVAVLVLAVGELCRENPRNLLADIVEKALVDALLEIDPDAASE